jgi:histidinol-phosphate phosphatase family protein
MKPPQPKPQQAPERCAVFLDKDGTLIEDVPYNVDPHKIRLTPGAADGLCLLHAAGYRLVVISNQSGVARGLFSEAALAEVKRCLGTLLRNLGVSLAGFYYCPHHPAGSVPAYRRHCLCRKPAPGMVLQAAHDLRLDLQGSWLLGDILDDVEAGRRAGCRAILIDRGSETEWRPGAFREPHHTVGDLHEAVQVILRTQP